MPDPVQNPDLPENLDRFTRISHFVLILTSQGTDPTVPWDRVEPKARALWEIDNPGTWEEYKIEIYQAWSHSRDPGK